MILVIIFLFDKYFHNFVVRPLHIKPLHLKTFAIVQACRGNKKLKYDQKSGHFVEVDHIGLDGIWSIDHKPKVLQDITSEFEKLNIHEKHQNIIDRKYPRKFLKNPFYPCTILFSTMNGFCSWRKMDSGTIFIEHLCNELNKRVGNGNSTTIELHQLAETVLKSVNDYRFVVDHRMLKQVPDIYLGNSFVEKLFL